MKIMTVMQIDPGVFDAEVNAALDEGYQLTDRRLVQTPECTKDYHYAQLILPDAPTAPEEPDVYDCAATIHRECDKHESCTECPLEDVCSCYPPNRWKP